MSQDDSPWWLHSFRVTRYGQFLYWIPKEIPENVHFSQGNFRMLWVNCPLQTNICVTNTFTIWTATYNKGIQPWSYDPETFKNQAEQNRTRDTTTLLEQNPHIHYLLYSTILFYYNNVKTSPFELHLADYIFVCVCLCVRMCARSIQIVKKPLQVTVQPCTHTVLPANNITLNVFCRHLSLQFMGECSYTLWGNKNFLFHPATRP